MYVTVLDAKSKWIFVEHVDSDQMIQRKLIPTAVFPAGTYAPGTIVDLPDELAVYFVSVGEVDLTAILGTQLPAMTIKQLVALLAEGGLWRNSMSTSDKWLLEMQTVSLQDALRRAGIWLYTDYIKMPKEILEVLDAISI